MNRNKIKGKHLVTCLVNFNPHEADWKNDTRFVQALKDAGTPLNSHYTKQILRCMREKYSGKKYSGKIRGTHAVLTKAELINFY